MTRSAPKYFASTGLAVLALLVLLAPAPAATVVEPFPVDGNPQGLAGVYLAARTADVEKDMPSAAGFYRSALRSDPDNVFLLERALVLSDAAGSAEEALGFAKRLIAVQPNNHAARLVLAVDDIKAARYPDAIAKLNESGAGVLAELTDALLAAWSKFGQGEVDLALQDLDKLHGEDWYEPFKLLHSGYIAFAAGRTADAIKLLGSARSKDGNAVRTTEGYARALAVAGRKDEAEAALKDFLLRFPDNSLARVALEDVRAGRPQVSAVTNPIEGTAEALAGLGAAIGNEGGTEVAFLYLQLALHLDPKIAGGLAALSLGDLLQTNNQSAAAIQAYQSISEGAPFRALGQMRAALALDSMDRTAEAEDAFKKAISADPSDIQTYISYGNMLRGRQRFGEAAEVYSHAIDRLGMPSEADWSIFYYRGISYERSKQWPKAEADFRKALELSPDQPMVLNYLGYSWVDKGENLDEAMGMIKKAVELRPNDGYIVDSLGWAHYRLGEYDDAVTELERAISLKPDDPVINDHLGDAYWKAGRTLEAQFQWRHARDFGAEGAQLELILKKIAEEKLIEATPLKKDALLDAVSPGELRGMIPASFGGSQCAFRIHPVIPIRVPDGI